VGKSLADIQMAIDGGPLPSDLPYGEGMNSAAGRMTSAHPDPAFPALHGRPDRGWLNDPNGCSYIDGRYHLFFQYNPDGPVHAGIKWGHVSSTDLVHWQQEPVALVNRPGELDEYGCWSGCVVDDAGTPTAVYSAVTDNGHRCVALLARSDRQLRAWQQGRKPVAGTPDDPAISHVRDPFVFDLDGHRYAIQGAGHTEGTARILIYGCDDLSSWSERGTLLSADDPVAAGVAPANVWECPNLVRLGDRWVLIVSMWRQVAGTISLAGVRYLIGELVVGPRGPRFTPASGGLLDRGPCFYAPQVLRTDGRILLWAWSWERGRAGPDIAAAGWAGALTFARELSLDGDVLVSRPAAELDRLRQEPLDLTPGRPFAAAAFDIELAPDAGRVGLWLIDGGDETLVAEVDLASSPVVPPRLLVDGSMVEIFDGTATPYTTRAYPTTTSRWLVRPERPAPLRAWRLGL
jgi:beta-fructofuranosidase